DGIRDYKVTGVQTCALPIYAARTARRTRAEPTRISYRVTDFSSPIRAGTVRFPPRGSVTCSGISFTRRNAATRRPRGIDARNGSHASAPTWTAYAPRTTIGPKTKATATSPTPWYWRANGGSV